MFNLHIANVGHDAKTLLIVLKRFLNSIINLGSSIIINVWKTVQLKLYVQGVQGDCFYVIKLRKLNVIG